MTPSTHVQSAAGVGIGRRSHTPAGVAAPRDFTRFDSSARGVLRRAGISMVGVAAIRAKGLISLPLALAILGAEGYGRVTAASTAASAIAPLVLLNVPDGAARLIVGATPEVAADRLLRLRRAATVVPAALAALAGGLALAGAGFPVVWGLVVAAAATAFHVGSVHLQYFQRTAAYMRLQVLAEYGSVAVGLGLAAVVGAAGMPLGLTAVLVSAAVLARRTLPGAELRRRRGSGPQLPFWRRALGLSVALVPVQFAQWALFSVDALIIYAALGPGATGAYSIAYSLASVAQLIPMAVNVVWPATAQRVLAERPASLPRLVTRGVALVTAAVALGALAAVLGGPLVERALHLPVYRGVAPCLPPIVLGFGALGLAKLFEGVLYARARIRPMVVVYALAAAVNVAANAVFVPRYGILAAAWITAATYALCAALLALPSLRVARERRGDGHPESTLPSGGVR